MMDLGPVEITNLSGSADVAALIVAATRMHDSLFHSPAAMVATLPQPVREAFTDLQGALERLTHPARTVRLGTGERTSD